MDPTQFITNYKKTEDGETKKIYFRRQLLPFILIISFMGLIVLREIKILSLTVDELIFYQDEQSRQTSDIIEDFKTQRNKAEIKLDQKIKEIKIKNTELTKITDELKDKESLLEKKEAEVASLQNQIKNQESQLATNSQELEKLRTRPPLFSFRNQSSQTDIENKKNQVRDLVTNAYDAIVEVYGLPYLLHSVTITFVDNFSINGASGEILISNSENGLSVDIRLKDFDVNNFHDVNAVIHEIIHSFHGVGVFETTVYEEGIAVAATDVVLAKLVSQKKLPQFDSLYLTISEDTYNSWNQSLSIPSNHESFYQSNDVTKYYQMAGFAWMKIYENDRNFFKNFNERYYQHVQKGETGNNELVKSIIKEVITVINGQPIETYLANQKAFNPI